MKLTFKLSFSDYYEYNKVYSKIAIGKNLSSIFTIGLFEAVIGAIALVLFFLKILSNGVSLLLGAILAAVGVYMMLHSKVFFYTKLKKEVRLKYKTHDYFKNERNVELADEYLLAYSDSDDYRASYREDLKEIIETKNLFIIMIHGRRGIIVPKSEVEQQEVRSELSRISETYGVRYRHIKE